MSPTPYSGPDEVPMTRDEKAALLAFIDRLRARVEDSPVTDPAPPTAYSASIEWGCDHAGVIRLHPHENGKFGDPFEWSAFIVRTGPESAEIRGVDKPISASGGRAVCRALAEHGIYRRHHLRREGDGVFRVVSKPTDPGKPL